MKGGQSVVEAAPESVKVFLLDGEEGSVLYAQCGEEEDVLLVQLAVNERTGLAPPTDPDQPAGNIPAQPLMLSMLSVSLKGVKVCRATLVTDLLRSATG